MLGQGREHPYATAAVQAAGATVLSRREYRPHSASVTLAEGSTLQAPGPAETHRASLGSLLPTQANGTGDPENYAGRIFDPRLRFATWKDMALAPRIDGLMTELDEAKRIAGYQALNVESSEKSWAIPLLQGITTVAYASTLQPALFDNGYVLPVEYKFT